MLLFEDRINNRKNKYAARMVTRSFILLRGSASPVGEESASINTTAGEKENLSPAVVCVGRELALSAGADDRPGGQTGKEAAQVALCRGDVVRTQC